MARIFISHSSDDNAEALALHQWLSAEGWGATDDLFLDIHESGGIAAGERWLKALQDAASRCEAVLFLMSEAWLRSKWCLDEYHLAASYHKKLFALLIEDLPLSRLPGGLASQWQVVRLFRRPARRFAIALPDEVMEELVEFSHRELVRLHQGLLKAGVGPETFTLQPDPAGPFGWRSPYRGLEALEASDAAVFFGREADTVRALDALRGLAERPDGHLLVILGASGAGKSSFLRAGLLPRLLRDDASWLATPPLRAGSEGAIDGTDGLLHALAAVRVRFGLPIDQHALTAAVASRDGFLAELALLREAAAERALLEPDAPRPRIVWPLDQAEELFLADAGPDANQLLVRLRESVEAGHAVVLATIRSDSYAKMQHAPAFEGLRQDTFSLLPVPAGEVARVIRAPAQVLRTKAGPDAPQFAPEVVAALQAEMAGEDDALPLLALALQRLVRDHATTAEIGPEALAVTGGVARAIEETAEAALQEVARDTDDLKGLVRRTFVPRLARVDRDSKAFQRRVVRQSELGDADERALIEAFLARRLIVRKGQGEASTVEVAHEALLRRWPRLVGLLEADRDGLLLLDGVLEASEEWSDAPDARREDFLMHRGSRLDDAVALADRGSEWQRELEPARGYLQAARSADDALREQQRRDFARRRGLQRALIGVLSVVLIGVLGLAAWLVLQTREVNRETSEVLAASAEAQVRDGAFDSALRLAMTAASSPSWLSPATDRAGSVLAHAAHRNRLRVAASTGARVTRAHIFADATRLLTHRPSNAVQIWNLVTGELLRELPHPDEVISARMIDDDARLISWTRDGGLRIWDVGTGETVTEMTHPSSAELRVRFLESQRWLVVWGSVGTTLRIFDIDTGDAVGVFEHRLDVSRARVTE
ncbi:MAG: TIR domain-containing protein, partial [Myxococcota bacterium]